MNKHKILEVERKTNLNNWTTQVWLSLTTPGLKTEHIHKKT